MSLPVNPARMPPSPPAPDEKGKRRRDEALVLALDATLTSIWDYDLTEGLVTLDENWARMCGRDPRATTTRIEDLYAAVHESDRPRATRALVACVRGHTDDYNLEHRVRDAHGDWIWVLSRGRVTHRDPAGRARRMIGTNIDVTRRKTGELATSRQLEFLRALNDTTLALLQRRAKAEILEALASRAASLLDAAEVEVALVEGEELVTHAYGGPVRTEAGRRAGRQEAVLSWRAIDTREPVIVDNYESLPVGAPAYQDAHFRAVAVFPILHGRRCLGVLGFLRDRPGHTFSAEEREKGLLLAQLAALVLHNADIYADAVHVAEDRHAALRESEARFKGVFDESPIPLILLSFPDGRITEVNKACGTVFGYTREEVIGRTTADLGIWADPADRAHYIGRLQAEGSLHAVDTRMRVKGGAVINVLYNASVITLGGRPCLLSSVIDITAQKQTEAALRQSEAALRQAQKMESLGTLAGGIAHDFNNILTGILGHTQLAMGDLPRQHPVQSTLQGIMQSGARARDLVQQILTFSRKTESERLPVKLPLVLMETLGLLRSTLPAMVRIDHAIDPACPPVLADGSEIHQVILNLCTNAWHALPETGGVIDIRLAPRLLDAAESARHPPLRPGPCVVLTVRDNGHGMDAATLERIYEPFFTTKAAGKGTGLGLAVVHSVVSAHGGAIHVESAPGRGTQFEILLPALNGNAASRAEPVAVEPPRGRGERVLVVDDEPTSGTVITRIIERLGYQAAYCGDPLQVAARLHAQEFDVLVTDLAMPGLPGDELARRVLARHPGLPVMLLSGFIEPDKLEKLRGLGVREILGKPPTAGDMAAALHRCLRR